LCPLAKYSWCYKYQHSCTEH